MSNLDLKAAADAVDKIEEMVTKRVTGLEKDMLAIKRQSRFAGIDGAFGDGAETKAMGDYFRRGETKALSVTSDGQGVSVRSDWKDQIFTLVRESSPMRQLASVVGTSKNEIEILVDREEPASDWMAEAGTRSGTAASFLTRHKIAVSEHYALPSATLDMLDDSDFPLESWLQGKVSSRFARQEASAFMNGNGVGQPRGILNYGTTPDDLFVWGADPANYEIGAVYSGVAGTLPAIPGSADPLADLVDAIKAPYLPGASWMMSRAMRNKIRKLKDSDGRFIYQASLDAGIPDRLMGYPVNLAEDMPALADGAVGALFGDFRQAYTIADRIGLAVVRDQYTTPGFVRWYVRRRVGGALTNPEAVKVLVLGVAP